MTKDGHEQVLGTVGKDGIFGEMALIDNQPRMAAETLTSTTIICVTRQMFDQKVNHADPFIRGLLKILADNNRDITGKWLSALNENFYVRNRRERFQACCLVYHQNYPR